MATAEELHADHQARLARLEARPAPLAATAFADHWRLEKEQRDKHHKETTERLKAESQIKRVPRCDGSSAALVRDWMKEVDLTIHYSPNKTTYIAAQTAEGALRRELERFLARSDDRDTVTWQTLREHLSKSFLTPVETERRRHEITTIKQRFREELASYNRRYVEVADDAYPKPANGERNDDQVRILLHHYIRGLDDDEVAGRLVKHDHPKTFEEAIKAVEDFAKDTYLLDLARPKDGQRIEEDMEVNAIAAPIEPWKPAFEGMSRKVDGITKQMTKMMSFLENKDLIPPLGRRQRTDDRRADNRQPRQRSQRWEDDGTPVCNFCQNVGHIAKQCRKKKAMQDRRNNGNQGGR